MHDIFQKIKVDAELNKEEIVKLLSVDNTGWAFYQLLYLARKRSEEVFKNKGYVFAQIGINAEPCSINCSFCSMAAGHYALPDRWRKSIDEIKEGVKQLVADRANDIFLMTTADYSIDDFIAVGKAVRGYIPPEIRFVANIGDFDLPTARKLKDAGFTGAYHIVRMREEIDTGAPVAQRVKTLDAIRDAGLAFYYCVEPIGPEHSYEEIVTEIFRAKDYKVEAMAVMRRTPVAGSPLFDYGAISTPELCKIAAVAQLVVRPTRSMNVHEVTEMSILAGINQLYAEAGANPRDTDDNTENNRGYTVSSTRKLLENSGYNV
ncbi:MAG: radical SAM protein [Dysgonamonadaceae bacterium]|jgi:biotin synthase|nr:radical SAM protein [Dysgonamonadaceae bacterium]